MRGQQTSPGQSCAWQDDTPSRTTYVHKGLMLVCGTLMHASRSSEQARRPLPTLGFGLRYLALKRGQAKHICVSLLEVKVQRCARGGA